MKIKKLIFASASALLLTAGVAYAEDFVPVQIKHPEVNHDGKVVVQGIIWHKCPHCKDLEPYIDNWIKNSKPDFVEYEIVPVGWGQTVLDDGKYYNYAKTLAKSNKISDVQLLEVNKALFNLVFNEKKNLSDTNVFPIFSSYGISQEDYNIGLKSFATNVNIKLSEKYTKDYNIEGTPSFVVGGQYAVNFNTIKEQTPKALFEAINNAAKKVKEDLDNEKANSSDVKSSESQAVSPAEEPKKILPEKE